jgi:hypothetical protein
MYVIFLHGPAAAGKHTIGTIVSEKTGLPLFHNHLTVDLVKTLFQFGEPQFVKLRETIWLASFQAAVDADRSFIFTFNPESTVDPGLIGKLQAIVEHGGGKVHYAELLCSDEAVLKRLGNQSRAKFGKLLDGEIYKAAKSQGGFDFPPLPPSFVTVDTEKLTAEESAEVICRALDSIAL